jgi:hypothetical protein
VPGKFVGHCQSDDPRANYRYIARLHFKTVFQGAAEGHLSRALISIFKARSTHRRVREIVAKMILK